MECSVHFTIVLIYQMWSLRSYAFKLKIVLYWEDDIYVDMCVYRFILKTVHQTNVTDLTQMVKLQFSPYIQFLI